MNRWEVNMKRFMKRGTAVPFFTPIIALILAIIISIVGIIYGVVQNNDETPETEQQEVVNEA